jgi:hypothetical protein
MITKTYTAAMQEASLSLATAGAMSSEPDGRLRAEHHRAQALAWLEYARELRLGGRDRAQTPPTAKERLPPADR